MTTELGEVLPQYWILAVMPATAGIQTAVWSRLNNERFGILGLSRSLSSGGALRRPVGWDDAVLKPAARLT
jgi:hypothetical protein